MTDTDESCRDSAESLRPVQAPPFAGTRLVAVLELGPSGARFLVARINPGITFHLLREERVQTWMATGRAGLRSHAAVRATLEAVRSFQHSLPRDEPVALQAIASAVMRDAPNGEDLLETVKRDTGLEVRVLRAAEEGRLGALAARWSLPLRRATVVDVGGACLQITRLRPARITPVARVPLGAVRASQRFLTKERWHVLYTNDERRAAYALIQEFRTRQRHEQGHRIGVHDLALDAVPSGYDKASAPHRPAFRPAALTFAAWTKALTANLTERLGAQLGPTWAHAHPRTLRRTFLNRPGALRETPRALVVELDPFPQQDALRPLVQAVNAARVQLPGSGGTRRRLLMVLADDVPQY